MSHQANPVKCVVWDLDNTIWSGVLLEDPAVTLRPQVKSIMHQLDERGILHSIASRNDPEVAMKKLEDFGLSGYFLYPQIRVMSCMILVPVELIAATVCAALWEER